MSRGRAAASRGRNHFGGVDIIVHCVGASFAKPGGTLALTDDDWDLALSTNLLAATRTSLAEERIAQIQRGVNRVNSASG